RGWQGGVGVLEWRSVGVEGLIKLIELNKLNRLHHSSPPTLHYSITPSLRLATFAEEDDAVGVGAFGHVIHSPTICGFGEGLIVDQDENWLETGGNAAGEDGLFEFGSAPMNLA